MIGIAAPPIGEFLQPVFTLAVIVLLSSAFLRLDIARLRHALRRPALVIAATTWTLLAIPLLIGGAGLALGLEDRAPALFLGVTLHAVASPMVAAPAFAALMGLDATLVLFALVASTMAIPLTAPLLAQFFLGPAANLSPGSLGLGLFAILGVSALAAAAIRRFASLRAIERYKDEINGVNVVFLFAFVAVTTRGVQASFRADPVLVLAITGFAFALFFAVLGVTILVFLRAGKDRAFALGFMTAQRNMGLMVAAASGVLPDLTWLYFALTQFPIYLTPALLHPLARRTTRS
jgi:BASS family bile acid:Na+ symporter